MKWLAHGIGDYDEQTCFNGKSLLMLTKGDCSNALE